MNKQSQKKRILKVLQERGMVPPIVFAKMGILKYTNRISELRSEDGKDIRCIELPRVNGSRRTAYTMY